MKNTISGFNQEKLLEYGLDLKDAMLLRYFVDFRDTESMSMIIVDNKPYYWVKYDHLKSDLPILGINSNDALRKRLKKLEECGILGHYHKLEGGSYSYYCLGDNYPKLIKSATENKDFNSYDPPTEKSDPSDSKVVPLRLENRTPPTQKSEQNNLSTKDNKNIYSANDARDDVKDIWNRYPNKKGKAAAIRKIPQLLKKYGKDHLIRCLDRYAKEVKGKDKQFILNGSTFFNGRYEDYLDCNYVDAKPIQNNKPKLHPAPKVILKEDM